jgi:hypothetical protein
MTHHLEGQHFWKVGNHKHVWVVDTVIEASAHKPAFAVLVCEDLDASEDVDLSHLENPEVYTPVPPGHHGGALG